MKGTLLTLILLGFPLQYAAAQPGFSATIFISAEAPTLPGATITATPSMINAPYTDSVIITVHVPQTGGVSVHSIIVTGKNGPSAAFDTVIVEFPDRTAWKWLTGEALEEAGISSYSQVLVDRRNALAYLIGSEAIGTWDGEVVTKLSNLPPGVYFLQLTDETGNRLSKVFIRE